MGWIGVFFVVLAYALISLQVIEPNSVLYIVFNLLGSAGIIVSSLNKKDFQPVVLNCLWILIALIALVRLFI